MRPASMGADGIVKSLNFLTLYAVPARTVRKSTGIVADTVANVIAALLTYQ